MLLPGKSHGQKSLAGSSVVAWEIPRTEEPGRLQVHGPVSVGHGGAIFAFYVYDV